MSQGGGGMVCAHTYKIHTYLGGGAGLVPDHCNKLNIAIKRDTKFLVS